MSHRSRCRTPRRRIQRQQARGRARVAIFTDLELNRLMSQIGLPKVLRIWRFGRELEGAFPIPTPREATLMRSEFEPTCGLEETPALDAPIRWSAGTR